MASEQLQFKIDTEWLCNFVRQRVWYEGLSYTDGLKTLVECLNGLSEEIADDILKGKKKLVGINEGELVDDNKFAEYKRYLERKEKSRAKKELEDHILLYPFNYIDPFATKWSVKEFKERYQEKGTVPTIHEVREWFLQPPADIDKLFEGGLYPLIHGFPSFIIDSDEARERYYEDLYQYWKNQLSENEIFTPGEITQIELRQRTYLRYKNRETADQKVERLLRENQIGEIQKNEELKQAFEKLPNWVIKEGNTYNLCEGSEAFYQRKAKFIPLEPGIFHEYGLIAPNGDFYACTFASHRRAAIVLAIQLGYIEKDEDGFISMEDEDKAKDLLYERGWVYVNSGGHGIGTFQSKWGNDKIEDFPKRIMDTAYDFIVWERNQRR